MSKKIKIGLAYDQLFVRQGISSLLKEYDNISVIFDVSNGKELLDILEISKPDIVLLDIEMQGMGGRAALERIRRIYPNLRVIMLSMHYSNSLVREYMKIGANSFIAKQSDKRKVIEAINKVHLNGYYFENIIDILLDNSPTIALKKTLTPDKTKRINLKESKVLGLLAQNKTNKEISELLFISQRTVERIRSRLLHKTGSKNLASLLKYALDSNLIS